MALVEKFSSITKSSGQTVVSRIRFWMTSIYYTLLLMQYGEVYSRRQVQEVYHHPLPSGFHRRHLRYYPRVLISRQALR